MTHLPGNRCYAQAPAGGLCQLDNGHPGPHATHADTDTPEAAPCGDHHIDHLGTTWTRALNHGHTELHCGAARNGLWLNHEWHDDHCRATTTTPDGKRLACALPFGHGERHVAVSGPSERYGWIGDPAPELCGASRLGGTGRTYTCDSPPGHPESHIDRGRAFSWPREPEGRHSETGDPTPDAPRWHSRLAEVCSAHNAAIARVDRDRAIEHAVRALARLGPLGFQPGPDDEGRGALNLYAVGIITLAKQLGDYIQNGSA